MSKKPDHEELETMAVIVLFCAAILVVYALGGPTP